MGVYGSILYIHLDEILKQLGVTKQICHLFARLHSSNWKQMANSIEYTYCFYTHLDICHIL